jgi:hypothetical protein
MKVGDRFIGIDRYVNGSVWEIIKSYPSSRGSHKSICVCGNLYWDEGTVGYWDFSNSLFQPIDKKSSNFKDIYDILNNC